MIAKSCRVRVGIATGSVCSGIIGADDTRLEQTVIGDVVNLAARLCSHDSNYDVLLCGNTAMVAGEMMDSNSDGHVKLVKLLNHEIKFKNHVVDVFTIHSSMYQ